jgi:hypothetical protein
VASLINCRLYEIIFRDEGIIYMSVEAM